MRGLKIEAKHYSEVRRLVEIEGKTPERAIAEIAQREAKQRRRTRKPREPREYGREMIAADYHKLIKERPFTQQTIRLAQSYGWYCFHDNDSRRNQAGFPDLFLVHPDRGVLFIELKTETGRVRPAQRDVLRMLRKAGQRAFIVRPRHRDDLEALLQGKDVPDDRFELVT